MQTEPDRMKAPRGARRTRPRRSPRGAAAALVVVSVVVGLVLTVATLALISRARLARVYAVPLVELPEAAHALDEGRRLYTLYGCIDCHGARLEGRVLIEGGPLGRYVAPNLTRGAGGVAARIDDDALVARAVRHGVSPSGRSLRLMPSERYTHLADGDVAALVAYLRHAAPVDTSLPRTRVALGGRILHALGFLELDVARGVDHEAPRVDPGEPAATAAYGRYVAGLCTGCHGADLRGGAAAPHDGAGTEPAVAGNLTPHTDGLAGWRFDELERAVRRGVGRDGRSLDSGMPSERLELLTDTELWALWAYLQQLPPLPSARP